MEIEKYSHGGDIAAFRKRYAVKGKIIDLSSNINFVKPNVKEYIGLSNLENYPNYDRLYKTLSKHYKVKKSQVELFNGASSAIFSFIGYLKPKRCYIYSPAYLEYKRVCDIFKIETKLINRNKNIQTKIKNNSLVIFINPSTPDGKYYDLEKFFKIWKKANSTILLDESFLEFCNKPSAIKFLNKYDKLYILKSLTKFYSSAGVRVGVLISNEKNIQKIKKFEPLWKISQFDSKYIRYALKDKKFQNKSKKVVKKYKKYLIKSLRKNSLIKRIYDSKANFLMMELSKIDSKTLQKHISRDKILIRDCSNFDFLDDRFVRIAIKDKKKLKKFIKALNKIETKFD